MAHVKHNKPIGVDDFFLLFSQVREQKQYIDKLLAIHTAAMCIHMRRAIEYKAVCSCLCE